jgi:hypothetical protein
MPVAEGYRIISEIGLEFDREMLAKQLKLRGGASAGSQADSEKHPNTPRRAQMGWSLLEFPARRYKLV